MEKMETQRQASTVLKALNKTDRHVINVFKLGDGSHTHPGINTAEHLLDSHFPGMTEASYPH